MSITLEDVRAAARRIGADIERTAFTRSQTLSVLTGASVFLKFENHQFTASFKERGALNRLLELTAEERSRGVIAMSAGNHAQAVAYHGRRLGIPTHIVMPKFTPNAKVEQTRVFGADVMLFGNQFEEARAYALDLARERSLTLVHPYDDPLVIAGQGTLGLEMIDQISDLHAIVVPIGGGGLVSGVGLAVKSLRPDVEVIGVQTERYPWAYRALHRMPDVETPSGGTVAEGIAVKAAGVLTAAMIAKYVDDIVLVSEAEIESAIFTLLEIEKTVTEGAGAAALAALQRYRERFRGRNVALVLSGGNIDMMILSSVLQRGLVRSHRLVRIDVEVQDVPGSLGRLTQLLGELESNIVDIAHQRAFGGSSVRAAIVELTLQMRGEEQVDRVLAALRSRGYEATEVYA
jgi:threonine dehydratase